MAWPAKLGGLSSASQAKPSPAAHVKRWKRERAAEKTMLQSEIAQGPCRGTAEETHLTSNDDRTCESSGNS